MVGGRFFILLERSRHLSYVLLFSFLLCNRRNRVYCFPNKNHRPQHPLQQLQLLLQPNNAIEDSSSSSTPTPQGLWENTATTEGTYDYWQKKKNGTAQEPAQNDFGQSSTLLEHHHHHVLQDTLTFRCETLGDHRASLANLVGYTTTATAHGGVDSSSSTIVVAVQPDRNAGRKLLFFQCPENDDDDDDDDDNSIITDTTTKFLGHILVEKEETAKISRLRGIQVLDRGKSYTSLFVSIWCQLCLEAGLQPTTVSINKPLLAWSLVRLGFHPTTTATSCHPTQEHPPTTIQASSTTSRPPRRLKKSQIRLLPLWVNIAPPTTTTSPSVVSISCRYPQDLEHLQDGFTDTELKSQRLVLTSTTQATAGGKLVQIRTPYEWSSSIPDGSCTALPSSSSSDGGGGCCGSTIVSSGDTDADPTTVASTTTSSLFRGGHCRLHFGASLLRLVVTGTGEQEREEEDSSISSSSQQPPRRSHRETAALYVLTGPLPGFQKTP